MNPPKVSVLIPVYNGARHLVECLESVLAQNFHDLEILISDDGSRDNSLDIIKQFAARDSHIRWWQNPRNVGLTPNTNVCIQQARGEYLKFLHQDDLLLSIEAIRKLVTALDEHPNATLAGCLPHLTGKNSRPNLLLHRPGCLNGKKTIVACLEQNANLIGTPSHTMCRRRHAQRGHDERFTGFMDFEMWCHLLEQGDYVYLAEPLASWRVHEHHHTARARESGINDFEHLQFMEICYAKPWLREHATDRMLFAQIYYLQKNYGKDASKLTSAMMNQLSRPRYGWQWLKHKTGRPLRKLFRKLGAE